MFLQWSFPYQCSALYTKKVGYFCMEFGIHQPLKTYAGGLGFLAGSHMRSAFEMRMPMVGIGILWKYGYYDQVRKTDQMMDVLFQEKIYGFLQETAIKFLIQVSGHDVVVTAYYLAPEIFNTCPVFFLTTDIPENDYLARTICHKLYDANAETKIASAILLGQGGAKLLEQLNWIPDTYHLNESHGLPLAFHLYKKFHSLEEVKKRLVFTNHTPEPGGNQQSYLSSLDKFGFFCGLSMDEVKSLIQTDPVMLDYTYAALQLAGKANGVSQLHKQHLQAYYKGMAGVSNILSVTNAQNFEYWHDPPMYQALQSNDDSKIRSRKITCKKNLFEEVADQTGEIYNPEVCTIVFAKRFTGYKRAELLLNNMDRFHRIMSNKDRPVQIIWAGKPYPMDFAAISTFDKIVNVCKIYSNCSILVGYEMKLSKMLKAGADIWLNLPRLTHEASGTSGMAAAMNGALNVSIADGWFPEFAKDGVNSFIIRSGDVSLPDPALDEIDAINLYDLLENVVIPLYYTDYTKWLSLVKNAMRDIIPAFDSARMVKEYYREMYDAV